MTHQEKQNLAEKIALLLSEKESEPRDANFLRESFEKINSRLEKIESQIQTPNPQNKSFQPAHFSQERFKIISDTADEIIENIQNEKACPYEPTGKPCDNCAMCNSRGF
ncbi:MAG: hypothetical protein ABIP06_03455 [Pyrinomonadaceae bacterium]